MKHMTWVVGLIVWSVIALGCSAPGDVAQAPKDTPTPIRTLRPTFTATSLPTKTVSPTPSPAPTSTPEPPTSTPTAPPTLPPTATPESPTATTVPPTAVPASVTPESPTATQPLPTATRPPSTATKAPPTPTKPPPTPQAKHVVGAHGVSGLVTARDKTTFATGEKAFFTYEALNHTQDPVGFEKLGIKASAELVNISWINPDVIVPGVPFKHDDGLVFDSPGTYRVMLTICFARCGQGDADWEDFPHGAATITVK